MPDADSTFERRLRLFTSVAAPTTVIAALLFYFGYVSTTAEFAWFGISLGSLDLSYQDVLLRSVGVMYVPLGIVLVVTLVCLWVHAATTSARVSGHHETALRRLALGAVVLGAALFVRGIVGVAVPGVAHNETLAATPLCLGSGVVLVAYGRALRQSLGIPVASARGARWVEVAARVAVAGIVVIALFWASNTFAAAYGAGRGRAIAAELESRTAVVLDTTERLYATYAGLSEEALPDSAEQTFRYRYLGLRLLIESHDRLFLVPVGWTTGDGAVLVVADDERVRVQFYRG